MDDYTRMWVEQHTNGGKEYARSGFVVNTHNLNPAPSGTVQPQGEKPKPKPEENWKMVVKFKPEGAEVVPAPVKKPDKNELLDTGTRYKMAMADWQVGKMMRSLKNPETNQTFWQCTECDYYSKSAKSSKFKVKSHVLKHHVQPIQNTTQAPPSAVTAAWKNNEWTAGTVGATFTVNAQPYQPPAPRVSQSPYDPVASAWNSSSSTEETRPKVERLSTDQVSTMMKSMKDPETGQAFWRCTMCDYFSKNAKSSKFKVERHILRHHKVEPSGRPRLSPPAETVWIEGEPLTMCAGYQPATVTVKAPQAHQAPPAPQAPQTPGLSKTEAAKQAERFMWSLKDPETGRTYWQCTECDYCNKSAKSSKFKVMRHVLRVHIDGLPPPTPGKGRSPKKELTELDRQVEAMMGSLQDPSTRRTIWLCTKCNYSQAKSATSKSHSHKEKMKRHILRKHIEGAKASQQLERLTHPSYPGDPSRSQTIRQLHVTNY